MKPSTRIWIVLIISFVLAGALGGLWFWLYPKYYDYGQKTPGPDATKTGSKILFYSILIGGPIAILAIGGLIAFLMRPKKDKVVV